MPINPEQEQVRMSPEQAQAVLGAELQRGLSPEVNTRPETIVPAVEINELSPVPSEAAEAATVSPADNRDEVAEFQAEYPAALTQEQVVTSQEMQKSGYPVLTRQEFESLPDKAASGGSWLKQLLHRLLGGSEY